MRDNINERQPGRDLDENVQEQWVDCPSTSDDPQLGRYSKVACVSYQT